MIRFIIFAGYGLLMMSLQISGKLNQYINIHYRYLALLSMALSLILAVFQLVLWTKNDKDSHSSHEHLDDHHHKQTPLQQLWAYLLLSLPLIVGFAFPTVSLDTTIVEAKGFQFPLSKESTGDPDIQTQYLKPDTSIFFEKSDYDRQMQELMAEYENKEVISITDDNYLEVMELIYNYPSDFLGKTVSFQGFVFHSKDDTVENSFVFRFGIIHCVADAGVFGLLTHLPEGTTLDNNDWVKLEGTITTDYYHPFKRTLPIMTVNTVEKIEPPENEYVYRTF
ncbi:TIGR03943 family putative permease subunit [uncultured Enterococcus sp.]|uniref:TIGR03943 family putative permease subunit n=1 Tax=uncultured Enterococcus sp. TaxID=167972 RepID=UPI002AA65759|nr:TIGR03943 family protein [uncultured Enterococcus sp.]